MSFAQAASINSGAHRAAHGIGHLFSSLGSHVGAFGVAALIAATIVLVFYALIVIISRPRNDLAQTLAPYTLKGREVPRGSSSASGRVITLEPLRHIADTLVQLAERRGLRAEIESRITRSGLPISLGELLVVNLVAGAILVLLGAVLFGFVGFVGALALTLLGPASVLKFLADRRTRRFESQLPVVLKLLAASLRAGFSLLQGLETTLSQVSEPMASEMRLAFAATRVGASVEDALEAVADRIGSRDFSWTVMAIRIQREVGGNLAEILDTVAKTMTARVQLRREVRTLTAEGRISAIILAIMPIAIGFFVYLTDKSYINTLFNSLGGQIALLVAVALELVGALWLYRTVQIET